MKYIYNKNIEETELTKPFLRTMKKLDTIHKTICICNSFDDDLLRDELEGKQARLIQSLTSGYNRLFNIEAKYSVGELVDEAGDGAILLEWMNQENITSIEEQIVALQQQ